MTKLEKFVEVFGFEPDVDNSNILPCGRQCPYYNNDYKMGCRCDSNALDWWYSDYEEPKTGHWIKYGLPRCGEQHYKCTNCDEYFNFGLYSDYYKKAFKYCPNCGAKMVEPQEKVRIRNDD